MLWQTITLRSTYSIPVSSFENIFMTFGIWPHKKHLFFQQRVGINSSFNQLVSTNDDQKSVPN